MKTMMRSLFFFVFVLFAVSCGSDEQRTDNKNIGKNTSELGVSLRRIVVFKTSASLASQDAALRAVGGEKLLSLPNVNGTAVLLPSLAAEQLLAGNADVLYVEEDAPVYASAKGKPPAPQPAQSVPWGVTRVGAPNVWPTTTGSGVYVAVVDTGVDLDHSDLAANIVAQKTFVDGTKNANDDNGHGTHVAGTVAELNNNIGYVGVAPDVGLLACKALNRNGFGWTSAIVACIGWSVQNGASVINMSLGSSTPSQSLKDACDNAYAAGVVVVAAAGNSGDGDATTDNVGYPAGFDSVVAVAATDSADNVPYWSSDGPDVELAAPGVSVPSAYKGGGYETLSGTSMASPHVSGVAALVRAVNPLLTPACVRSVLAGTALDLGDPSRDVFYGYGLVRADAAVQAASVALCP